MGQFRAWTDAEDARLRRLWLQGIPWYKMDSKRKRRISAALPDRENFDISRRGNELGLSLGSSDEFERSLRHLAAAKEATCVACAEQLAGMPTALAQDVIRDLDAWAKERASASGHNVRTTRKEAVEWLKSRGIAPSNRVERSYVVWQPLKSGLEFV